MRINRRPSMRSLVARPPQSGSDLSRQDGNDATCLSRSGADAQSVEPCPHAGRIEQRLGRGGGQRHVRRRCGNANRRVNSSAGGLLRIGRLQTDLGKRADRGNRPAQPKFGHARADRAHRRRCRRTAERDARPWFAAAAGNGVAGDGEVGPGRFRVKTGEALGLGRRIFHGLGRRPCPRGDRGRRQKNSMRQARRSSRSICREASRRSKPLSGG